MSESEMETTDFIRAILTEDVKGKKNGGRVVTRFPPEPNGYLHIGHAKAICLNFGIAQEIPGGICHLRFDDTNPTKENQEYMESIKTDVRWLGFDWGDGLFYASDNFERLYEFALHLIRKGRAYVDSLSADDIRQFRGTLTEPGKDSPFRNRTVQDNLQLFAAMRAGEFDDGEHVLRAKIDMASPNINLRDPTLYRIRCESHYRRGHAWSIYPTYDFAHPLSDSIEGITHSLCTLEFEDHRPLYDWVLNECEVECHSQQIEFARLNLNFTVLSKRKLLDLVQEGHVAGWDDPRLPTLMGLRRRGFPPEAIRNFCDHIGVAKHDGILEIALLEHFVREELNRRAPRVMAVLRPLRIVITNYPEGHVEELTSINNPEDPNMGSRLVPFSREIYIEQDDFREDPPKKFFRLAPGQEVRLRYAYIIKCVGVVKDPQTQEVTEVHCTYDPETRSGGPQAGRKVKGTLHWVSASHGLEAEVRLYDNLFSVPNPSDSKEGQDYRSFLNPHSLETVSSCYVEPSLAQALLGTTYQFERLGYFCVDNIESSHSKLIFNRTVPLRDSWSKIEKAQSAR